MRKWNRLTAGLVVLLGFAAPTLAAVQITPDFVAVWVPWNECVLVSVSTIDVHQTYEWNYDGTISGASRNFSVPEYYCNPGSNCTSFEDHSIGVYATDGSQASYDSVAYTVYFEPGNSSGGCGTAVCC